MDPKIINIRDFKIRLVTGWLWSKTITSYINNVCWIYWKQHHTLGYQDYY